MATPFVLDSVKRWCHGFEDRMGVSRDMRRWWMSWLSGTLRRPCRQSQRASIWLCGPLRVQFGARRVEALLPARQGRLVFAYLVLRRERPVARDELVEALWPGRSPEHPNAALDTLISRLRGALGADRISGRRELSLVLGPDPWIDVEVAQAAVAAGRTALEDEPADEAFSCAEQALGVIKQPLLRDLDRPWLDDHRRQLEALRPPLLAVMGRAGLLLGGSALAHGVEAAREMVALEPFGESARELLMRLLAAAGDVAEQYGSMTTCGFSCATSWGSFLRPISRRFMNAY
jgi:DNA-binding SARP family transcriptional activator